MSGSGDFKRDLLAMIPKLRAFAISLCGSVDRADDLVQEAMVKAWANQSGFMPGTNFGAWMFTILRNAYFSELRKRQRETEDVDGQYAAQVAMPAGQETILAFHEFRDALPALPEDQREALLLVGAAGFSYEEAAEISGCAVGTIKSRVNRARVKLAQRLGIDEQDVQPDQPNATPLSRLLPA
jgi:RNA polymerase sigma-70 factor (ECF subfamily)